MRVRLIAENGSEHTFETKDAAIASLIPNAIELPVWTGEIQEDEWGRRPAFGKLTFRRVTAHDDELIYREVIS